MDSSVFWGACFFPLSSPLFFSFLLLQKKNFTTHLLLSLSLFSSHARETKKKLQKRKKKVRLKSRRRRHKRRRRRREILVAYTRKFLLFTRSHSFSVVLMLFGLLLSSGVLISIAFSRATHRWKDFCERKKGACDFFY